MIPSLLSHLQGPLIAFASGLAYYLTYKINGLFDSWVTYAPGISLIFLPAGIKHISILIAGRWGALGCMIALFFVASNIWAANPVSYVAAFSAISIGATWLGISLALKLLQIDRDLSNLKFLHLPLMDLVTTVTHSLASNAYLAITGIVLENFWGNALAMILGDFTGCFIILTFLFIVLRILKRNNASL